jgi:hypothetical protein
MAYLQRISFWYLVLFLFSSVAQDFQSALLFNRSADYSVFEANGLSGFFPACLTLVIVLDFAASYYVFHPRPGSFWVILAALAVAALYNIVVFGLASNDLEATKAAYVASRELRGLSANDETASKVFSPEGMRATLAISLLFAFSSLGALAINRWRFFPPAGDP